MSQRDATAFIETYFKKYPSVGRYIIETKQFAAEHGYLTTLYGRRRDFSILKTLPQGPQRLAIEREAINSPIQGSAADIMKQAMINLNLALRTRGLKTRILLQVHDELVLEAPEGEVDQAAQLTREVMSTAFTLNVPLIVDVEAGLNWLDMEAV
jgi:DNA polymerase-1